MDGTRIIAAILAAGIVSKGNLSSMGADAKGAIDTFLEVEKALRTHVHSTATAAAASSAKS